MNRGHELLPARFLEENADRTGLLGLLQLFRTLRNREEEDPCFRAGLSDKARCRYPIHDRYAQIHEHEVRLKGATKIQGFLAIGRFANDRQVWFASQQEPQARPSQLVIINDEEPSRRGT